MDISIIIPNFNQADALNHTLDALAKLVYPTALKVETVVVDNESTDESAQIIKKHDARKITNQGSKNPYIARNLGIARTESEIIAFLDAKSSPAIDWLENGVSRLTDNINAIVCGHFDISFSEKPDLEEYAYALMYLDNEYSSDRNGTYPGQNFFVRRETINKVGSFNEHRSGSDNEWFQRARNLGIDILFDKKIQVSYKAKNKKEFYSSIKRFGKGARDNWLPQKGKLKTNLIALSYFFPMSIAVFHDKLKRRKLPIQGFTSLKVWLVIWKARRMFAQSMLGL